MLVQFIHPHHTPVRQSWPQHLEDFHHSLLQLECACAQLNKANLFELRDVHKINDLEVCSFHLCVCDVRSTN